MRTIGHNDRSDVELDPCEAWRRGARLDAMLRAAMLPWPRGVWRGTHEAMARQDLTRTLAAARRINSP